MNKQLGRSGRRTKCGVKQDDLEAEDIDDVHDEPRTSNYKSIDSTSYNIVGVCFLSGKHVTELADKHQESSLGAYASSRKKFKIGKEVEIYYESNAFFHYRFISRLLGGWY